MRGNRRQGPPGGSGAPVELDHEVQVGCLALLVRGPPAIALFRLQVGEVDPTPLVREARDGHDPGRFRSPEVLQQQPGQSEVTQVVDPELLLEAVLGQRPRGGHDPGIVHEHVQREHVEDGRQLHSRREVRIRKSGVRGNRRQGPPGGSGAPVELDHEVQVGCLALLVRGPPAIALFRLQVGEVDPTPLVREARDGHDPGRFRSPEVLQQQPGQSEVTQVVDPELLLEAVLGQRPRGGHDPGIVHEHVQRLCPLLGEPPHRGEARQIEQAQLHGAAAAEGANPLFGVAPPPFVAAGEDHAGALAGQGCGCLLSDAAVRARDDRRPAGLVGNGICSEGVHSCAFRRWGMGEVEQGSARGLRAAAPSLG